MYINTQTQLDHKRYSLIGCFRITDERLLVSRIFSLICCAVYGLAWIFQPKHATISYLDTMFYPFLFIVHALLATILFLRPFFGSSLKNINIVMLLSYGLFYLYLIFQSQTSTHPIPILALAPEYLLLIYAVAFFVLEFRTGLYVSLGLLFMISLGLIYTIVHPLPAYQTTILTYAQITSLIYIPSLAAITHLRRRYIKLSELAKVMSEAACIDALTSIYNRRYMNMSLDQLFEQSNRHNSPFTVIMFDIDKFKAINDTYGHNEGDKVLQQISNLIGDQLRRIDIFGRWGGEEFIIILPSTDSAQAQHLAERLRLLIEQHSFDTVGSITASFGVTSYNQQDTPLSLMERVDTALYQAKQNGRNCLVVS
jgi:diguanylate cyclase (GGDEF)-like protein